MKATFLLRFPSVSRDAKSMTESKCGIDQDPESLLEDGAATLCYAVVFRGGKHTLKVLLPEP